MSCIYCDGDLSVNDCDCYLATRARKYTPKKVKDLTKEVEENRIKREQTPKEINIE